MVTTFSTPGVYIQEIPKLPASVAQVATAVPAFMGYTEIDPGTPVRITSMLEFGQNFGGPQKTVKILKESVDGVDVYSLEVQENNKSYLYHSMQLYFTNGGGPCFVVSTGQFLASSGTPSLVSFTDALDLIALEDEPTLLVSPDSVLLTDAQHGTFVNSCLTQCNNLQDRFTIIDVKDTVALLREKTGSNNLKYGAAYFPNLITTLGYTDSEVYFNTSVVTGIPANTSLKDALEITTTSVTKKLLEILPVIRALVSKRTITVPPSGAIAGIYAAVDASRGVWKAPANVSINAVVAPVDKVTDNEQGNYNIDATSGKSINVIRTFTGKGTLVWGARTLAGNDNEWKFINVRRLFITAEESIKKATAFVVFEPNDANTWVRTKAMIENYLTGLWRDGALAGATPQEAFFVNVGLGITMTSEDILNGRLNIEVGMAAVRPAEFIILSFSHKLQTS